MVTQSTFKYWMLLLVFNCCSNSSFCQSASNTDTVMQLVKVAVTDSNSEYFYPRLLKKLKTLPGKLDKADMFYLYYGELFQTVRRPFGYITDPEAKPFARSQMNGNCKATLWCGMELLKKFPLDLTVLLHVNLCLKREKQEDTNFLENRFNLLLDAILMTGDGSSKANAIMITHIEDDRIMKGILGFLGGWEALDSGYSIWRKGDEVLYFQDLWTKKFD